MVKYGMYQKERSKKYREDIFRTENWEYNHKEKYYICPNGRKLNFKGRKKSQTESGYPKLIDRYECESCKYCRIKKQCTKKKGNRIIERNDRWLRLKNKAQQVLKSEQYKELYKQRSVEVETVFGQFKGNQGYRRFLLRGMSKVSTEWGLLAFGYNLKQIYRINKEKSN